MIKIAGHWELDWNLTPEIESWMWIFPMRDFDIKDLYMWPIEDVKSKERQVKLHQRNTITDILEENKHLTKVFVEPQNPGNPKAFHNGISLEDFEHPKDVLYMFGSFQFSSTRYKTNNDLSVDVPTIHNKGVLYPHQCLVTVLYDRLIKRGKDEWQ